MPRLVVSLATAFVVSFVVSHPALAAPFRRGEVNADGSVSLSDAIATLSFLFLGTFSPPCLDAADANDDGRVDIVDAVRILAYLFLGDAVLPPPTESCGEDSTPDTIGCAAFPPCADASDSAALLNEVLARPLGDDPALAGVRAAFPDLLHQFVEIRMVAAGRSPSGLRLQSEPGGEYTIPAGIAPLPAGAVFLVRFDDGESLLEPGSGTLELLDLDGAVLDRVAWGPGRPDAVVAGQGGAAESAPPGTSYARRPGTTRADSPDEWVVTLGPQATPGEPNRHPGAGVLFPAEGAILEAGAVTLDWYGVPGATGYRVVLSRNADLSAPIHESVAEGSQPVKVDLTAGDYFWQMTVLDPAGALTAPTAIRSFRVVASYADLDGAGGGGGGQAGAIVRRTLSREPPIYQQRKDTSMLLLESDYPSGTRRAWDAPHPFDKDDPACNANCALATISMANAYFSGVVAGPPRLSQDRIALEVHSQFREVDPGPEMDFNFGKGLEPDEYAFGLSWALGTTVSTSYFGEIARVLFAFTGAYPPEFHEQFWNALRESVDNRDRPVPISAYYGSWHAVLVWGYQESPGGRFVLINDPWASNGRYWLPLGKCLLRNYFIVEGSPDPRADDEDLVSGIDSDEDGLSDFDERMRFNTNWKDKRTDKDTDSDCIEDYEEVRRSVFDDRHGWGRKKSSNIGDGKARDGARPEIDLDSDGGGLPDFVEDADQDGEKDAGESDPYNPDDDRLRIDGTIEDNIDLHCADPGAGISYHDLTHKESATSTFHLEVTKNADRKGTLTGMIKIEFHGLNGFWVSDAPGDCGEAGLSRTIAPYTWEGRYEGKLVCKMGPRGPELHLETRVVDVPPNPSIHEHFCDYNFDARPHVAPARPGDRGFLTWYVPGGKPMPIDGPHVELESRFDPNGCYTGDIHRLVKLDIQR
jgi:hypothetical protein